MRPEGGNHFHLHILKVKFFYFYRYTIWGLGKALYTVTVWFATASVGIIGTRFFGDENGNSITITSKLPVQMIYEFLCPLVAERSEVISNTWFHQPVIQLGGQWMQLNRCCQTKPRYLQPGTVT